MDVEETKPGGRQGTKRLLSAEECAEQLGLPIREIYRLSKLDEDFPAFSLKGARSRVCIDRTKLDDWIDKQQSKKNQR